MGWEEQEIYGAPGPDDMFVKTGDIMSDYQDFYESHGYPVPDPEMPMPVDPSYNVPDTEFGKEEESQ